MQQKIYTILVFLFLFTFKLWASPPTTAATNVSFSSVDGGTMHISWTNGNGARRIVIAKQLDAVTAVPVNGIDYFHDDDFTLGQEIAPGEFVVYDGNDNDADIRNLQPNTLYHFKIYEYNGSGATTEYLVPGTSASRATLMAPTAQATDIVFSNITGNAIKISWTPGNGNKRLVLAKEGSAVNANPADLVNYTGSGTFGSGAQVGSGNYVVYFGTGNTVTVTSLSPGKTYHFAVFEANGASTPVFYTVNPLSGQQATLDRPSVAASGLSFSQQDGNSIKLSWTNGNGSRRIVVARAGQPVDAIPQDGVDYIPGQAGSMSFATAPEISPSQKVIYDNTGTNFDFKGFAPSTTYFFKIFEYDGTGTSIAYQVVLTASGSSATVSAPTTQATGISFSNVTGNSIKATWTNGNGSKRLVLVKAGAPVDATPADLVNYSPQASFPTGAQIGSGNYVVHFSTGNTVTVTGLATNQTYHFAVFEANGFTAPVFNSVSPATGSQATTDRPTVAAGNMSFTEVEGNEMRVNWTNGNGQRRIVIVKEGAPVTALPEDGTDYLAATTANFTTAPEIIVGEKVVYDNTGNYFNLKGLTAGKQYHYRVFEYSGTGTGITYLTSAFASGSFSTLSAPLVQASNISFTNTTGNALTINWTNGSGTRRIILMKQGAPVDAVPSDYAVYSSSTVFKNGAQLGTGNYVVYTASSGNSATITGLSLSTTYHFAIFEANGSGGPVYLTTGAAIASQQTKAAPTVAPGNLSYSSVDGNSMRINWAAGNGEKRILVVRAGMPVDAVPQDGVDYLATGTSSFVTAPEITAGQKVVFDNTGTFTDLAGLSPNTTYYFRVYEYSGSGEGIAYLTSAYGSGEKTTLSHPTIQASGLSFSSITASSMIVSWTNGNGSSRMVIAKKGSPVDVTPADLQNYSGSNSFGNGTQLGSGNFVVSKNSGSNFTLNNLTAGSTYHFAVFEYNGSAGVLFLVPGATGQATTIGPPAVQASAAFTSNAGNNSVQLHWVNGSGNKRLVVMKQASPVNAMPVNNTDYFANSFFGSGSHLGDGNYVVFDGLQDFVTVTNLLPGTTYHFAVFEYNDFGVTSQYLLTSPAVSSSTTIILPVKLLHFKAAVKFGRVELDWATAAEVNSSHYVVERSVDGITFNKIAQLTAAGTTQEMHQYNFSDPRPLNGWQYYRLKQVDVDGSFTYSPVIRLFYKHKQIIKRFGNPVSNTLPIEVEFAGTQALLRIFDMSGRQVKTEQLSAGPANIDMSLLKSGVYIVEVSTEAGSEKIRIVKQ